MEFCLLAEQRYFSSRFRVEGGKPWLARGVVVVAKPLSRVSWKRFAGGERRRWMDGWLCAFPCQYVDKSFWRDVGRREVFSVTSRHGGPKGNENDAFRRPFVAYPLYIYIYIYSSVPFCSFLSFFFISILILPRFAAFLFSFSISRPTDPPFSLRSTRGKLTATLIPLLFSFFLFVSKPRWRDLSVYSK